MMVTTLCVISALCHDGRRMLSSVTTHLHTHTAMQEPCAVTDGRSHRLMGEEETGEIHIHSWSLVAWKKGWKEWREMN
jgi:hypothetical protein